MTFDSQFWRGRRVLITGQTGFKGAWLSTILLRAGAAITGIALAPSASPNLFELLELGREMDSRVVDIRDGEAVERVVRSVNPECVLHLAAQSLVRSGYDDPVGTYATNVMGTVNLLQAMRVADTVRCVIVVTSDKCYENREWLWGYRENERMGGDDPYSSSKGAAELVVQAYRRSFFADGAAIASARAGNVIGGGDWSKDRLVPDLVHAALSGTQLTLRNATAVRPWQHVLESLSGYLLLAQRATEKPREFASAWNFGPSAGEHITVERLATRLLAALGSSASVCKAAEARDPHEAHLLNLDSTKARTLLNWRSRLSVEQTIAWTAEWYRAWHEGADVKQTTLAQIEEYFST